MPSVSVWFVNLGVREDWREHNEALDVSPSELLRAECEFRETLSPGLTSPALPIAELIAMIFAQLNCPGTGTFVSRPPDREAMIPFAT